MKFDIDEITGRTTNHLSEFNEMYFHRDVVIPLKDLLQKAQQAGHNIAVASSFRSFDRQMKIWCQKYRGERALYNFHGEKISVDQLSEEEILKALLRWSAIPGFSRHHWGTDFDIYDSSKLPSDDYQLKLTPDEYGQDGPFYELSCWLESEFSSSDSPFVFPYHEDKGGIAPEPWHISYRPIAEKYEQELTYDRFISIIKELDFPCQHLILKRSEEIYKSYISPSL